VVLFKQSAKVEHDRGLAARPEQDRAIFRPIKFAADNCRRGLLTLQFFDLFPRRL
jgi:hypothetical protein